MLRNVAVHSHTGAMDADRCQADGRGQQSQGDYVVIKPVRRTDEGLGVYGRRTPLLVKKLREAGLQVEYEDPPEGRRFLDQNSAMEATEAVLLGLVGSGAYDALKWATLQLAKKGLELRRKGKTESGQQGDMPITSADAASHVAVSRDANSQTTYELELISHDSTDAEMSPYVLDQIEQRLQRAEAGWQRALNSNRSQGEAETVARSALADFASALNWAEDSALEGSVHARMDQAGRWVREEFGCTLRRDGNEYSQTCPVALAHNRIGLSIGGYSRKLCSICGDDFSECQHQPGVEYRVQGGVEPLGWCRVCGKREGCEHLADETYRARLIVIVVEMDLDEISLVAKPAYPDARLTSISYSVQELKDALGNDFEPGVEVDCNRCLPPCGGLKRLGSD